MKRVFSGVRPTGNLTIGNYIGAISRWVELQNERDCIFSIVDLHAITTPIDPKELRNSVREVAKIYIACGIDPKKSNIFIQSHRPEVAELSWILSCNAYFGELRRMTQFKEKSEKHPENVNAGLFNYPVLMTSDIILYQTDEVPVGEDQKQHVEIARDLAVRMNNKYGKIFTVPEVVLRKEGARIMNLQDPTKKMDKSDSVEKNVIRLRDSEDLIREKIKKAVTDEQGIENLAVIHSSFSGEPTASIKKRFADKNADFKSELAEVIINGLKPIQEKLTELDQNPEYIEKILNDGAEKVRPIAEKTMAEVKNKIGLG